MPTAPSCFFSHYRIAGSVAPWAEAYPGCVWRSMNAHINHGTLEDRELVRSCVVEAEPKVGWERVAFSDIADR